MNGFELRQRRKMTGMTQAQFAREIHVHRDCVGMMERDDRPITQKVADAVIALSSPPSDSVEQLIELALLQACVSFAIDRTDDASGIVDFHLLERNVVIRVKRSPSNHIDSRSEWRANLIVVQGELSVRLLASWIRTGHLTCPPSPPSI